MNKKYVRNSNVKRYRQFSGFTQKEMSKNMNIPLSSYQQKEQGYVSFSDNEKYEIKKIVSKKIGYEITIDDIFF